jgi:hypothetical protein
LSAVIPIVPMSEMTAAPVRYRRRHTIALEMTAQADLRHGTSIDTRSL